MKLLFAMLVAATSIMASTVTLTMGEVPEQPIDGLTVTKDGESFTFSDPGGTMQYNFTVPGTQLYLTNPGMVGLVEEFGVTFSTPVDSIQFGMAETSLVPLSGVGVTLFNGANEVFSTTFDLIDTNHPAVENLFTWAGTPGQVVTRMEIDPVTITDPLQGPDGAVLLSGIDNLSVNTTPEPSTFSLSLLMLTGGLVAAGAAKRRFSLKR